MRLVHLRWLLSATTLVPSAAIQPAPGTPFPEKGGSYGPNTGIQLCFPLPDVERNNNPNIGKTG